MIENDVEGVDFICANTDAQALSDVESKTILHIGLDRFRMINNTMGSGVGDEVLAQVAARLNDVIRENHLADAMAKANVLRALAGGGEEHLGRGRV